MNTAFCGGHPANVNNAFDVDNIQDPKYTFYPSLKSASSSSSLVPPNFLSKTPVGMSALLV